MCLERWTNLLIDKLIVQGVPKTDTQFYFWDNFGNSAPILTILSLLQAEIYGAFSEVLSPTALLLCDHIT